MKRQTLLEYIAPISKALRDGRSGDGNWTRQVLYFK